MNEIANLQQHFLPASKGLIKSSPASLISDGAFQEVDNVRFGDGYVEKVKAFNEMADLKESVVAINLMKETNGVTHNLVHTTTKLYKLTNVTGQTVNIMPDGYNVSIYANISARTIFDNYIFCALGNNIMYWDGSATQCKKLEGTYDTDAWIGGKAYTEGTIIKPKTYSGYIYECTTAGTSGTTEPTWAKNLTEEVTDGACRWKGVGGLEIEGDSATNLQAQCIENYKGFVFLANTTEDSKLYPSRLRWSQWQNPRLWHNNEDGSGMAGYVDCDDTSGKIYAIKKLGDYLFVYKEDGILVISYTGGDTIFEKSVVTSKACLIAPNAIVELPHAHIFVGTDDIYYFDGSTATPIGTPIKDFFFNKVDPQKLLQIYGYYNEDSGDVVFAFDSTIPHDTNRDKAITYNINTKVWSMRDMNMTTLGQYLQSDDRTIDDINIPFNEGHYMIDSSLYSKSRIVTIAGDAAGKIYRLEGYVDSRGDYEGYVVSKVHHMEDPGHIKRLLRIQFHIETEGDYNLQVQVGWGWNAETSFTWTKPLTMGLKAPKPPFVDVDLSARYFAIRFGTSGNSQPFRVLGYTLYYQTRSDE